MDGCSSPPRSRRWLYVGAVYVCERVFALVSDSADVSRGWIPDEKLFELRLSWKGGGGVFHTQTFSEPQRCVAGLNSTCLFGEGSEDGSDLIPSGGRMTDRSRGRD